VLNVAEDQISTGIGEEALPVADAIQWATQPGCGSVVTFCGTVRDCSDERAEVISLENEAYDRYAAAKLATVARNAHDRWPQVHRVVLLHRVGVLAVEEVAVVVVVASPHRTEAFDAARFCIDTLKATVPLWKRETWSAGVDWRTDARPLQPIEIAVGNPK
jgi:molybdopterin synthase catalytic subunit